MVRAFGQLGKSYDFNFDVDKTDEIVCSELVHVVYDDIDYETEKIAGRFTISPENVVAKVFDGTMEIVTLYHDGSLIENDRNEP